jgi:hypothetical protein
VSAERIKPFDADSPKFDHDDIMVLLGLFLFEKSK